MGQIKRIKFSPRPYQEIGIQWMLDNPRCALWAGMGMGKTVTSLTALSIRYEVMGETRPTLVLGPKRVAKNVWPRETQKWDHLSGLDVVPIIGTPQERMAALRADAPVKTINYENLKWLVDTCAERKVWPFKNVIADESTRLKNFRLKGQGGTRATAIGRVAHKHVDTWVNLTGTPAPNGLIDLWGQTWFLDEGTRLGRSFGAFERRWFAYQRPVNANNRHEMQRIIMPFAEEQIHDRLTDVCLTLDPKDWFDIQNPIKTMVEVDLPPSAARVYREMEKKLFTILESGDEVEAQAQGAATMKCLQIASGAVWVDRGAGVWKELHKAKLEALDSIIEEAAGMPVLVSYFFKPDLAMLKAKYPQGVEFTDSQQVEDDWNAGKIPIMFIHPASAGHGVNLQDGGNILVFYSHWWDGEQHDQVIERIGPVRQLQAGHERPVFLYYLVARNTIDQVVIARTESKARVQDALMDYMNRTRRS